MMKRLTVIGVLAIFMTGSAFACGPMTSGGGGQMTSGGSGNNTKRQKWVKKRIERLNQKNEDYRAARLGSKLGGSQILPFAFNREDANAYDHFQSIQKQHKREQIELMMLKNELGEISPDERKALVEFLKKRRGHVQGQSRQRSNQ